MASAAITRYNSSYKQRASGVNSQADPITLWPRKAVAPTQRYEQVNISYGIINPLCCRFNILRNEAATSVSDAILSRGILLTMQPYA